MLVACFTVPPCKPAVHVGPCRRCTVQAVNSVDGVKANTKKAAALAASVLIAGVSCEFPPPQIGGSEVLRDQS